jgi:hypothetical protein
MVYGITIGKEYTCLSIGRIRQFGMFSGAVSVNFGDKWATVKIDKADAVKILITARKAGATIERKTAK